MLTCNKLIIRNALITSQKTYWYIEVSKKVAQKQHAIHNYYDTRTTSKSFLWNLSDFRHARGFLTHDAFVFVANALVSSWLDYCNSLYRSPSKLNLRKLQCIQNSAARIIPNTSRYTSITHMLKKLHCLLVEHRSFFKTATFVYKFLHIGFPQVFCSIYLFLQQFFQYQVQSEWW